MKVVKQKVEFITATPQIGDVIEYACRTCYKSHNLIKEGSTERLFNQVVKQRHHDSVTEHGSITVQITTDRAMLAQITRHRIGTSFSVESQRYCNYSKDKFNNEVSFIRPYEIKEGSVEDLTWTTAMQEAERHYFNLIKTAKPQTARAVLPNSTKVELTMTGNVRAWRHFFSLRADGHAQEDIQHLCKLIHDCFIENGIPAYLFDDVISK